MPRQLLVESIRIDGKTQSRERINEATVAEYAEAMKDTQAPAAGSTGSPQAGSRKSWPAISVYFDGTQYWLADGFHRLLAVRRLGWKNILADVRKGSREDAAWASCAANQTHGLRRTNADKRKAVEIALTLHPEKSDRAIAGHCGLSDPFVGQVRRQVLTVSTSTPPPDRVGKDGKHYPPPAQRAAGQGPSSRAELTAGRGLGPPPRREERRGPADTPAAPVPATEPPHSAGAGSVGRKADGPLDDVGRRIPEHLLALWERRQEVQDMLTALSRVRVALRDAQDNKDPLYSEIPFSSALLHLDQAYNAVQVAKPYAVCAFCQGHGCKACGQRGLLGKFRWDTCVPREHKEAVARIIEKDRGA